jgi:hypothetical protein
VVVTKIIVVTQVLPTDIPPPTEPPPLPTEPPPPTETALPATQHPFETVTAGPATSEPIETATPAPATDTVPTATRPPLLIIVVTQVVTVVLPTPEPTFDPGPELTATAAAIQAVQTSVGQPGAATLTAVAAQFATAEAVLNPSAEPGSNDEATQAPGSPSPTPTAPTVSRPVIRADWPGRLEVGTPDTISVRLTYEKLLATLPTVAPDQTASVATPIPVGTPQVPLERAFGEEYTACATASLLSDRALQARLLTPEGCLPLDGRALAWTWQVTAAEEGPLEAELMVDVVWTPKSGGQPITKTVWLASVGLAAERPLIASRPLGALSLASAGLGMALVAPLTFRRGGRELVVKVPPPAHTRPPTPPAQDDAQLAELLGIGAAPSATRAQPGPHLNTAFKGLGPDEPLTVGRRTSLFVWVGEAVAASQAASSRPFAFRFGGTRAPVSFIVRLDADPACWQVEAAQPVMVVTPPGTTEQAAVFRVTALTAGRDKLYLSVEQAESGAAVQHVWLPVTAVEQARVVGERTTAALDEAPAAGIVRAVRLPLDAAGLRRREVRITVASGRDAESFRAVVDAELPGGHVHRVYDVPVSGAAVQNATLRLRQELERVVLFAAEDAGSTFYPFADPYSLTVEAALARQALVGLADAGQQVWQQLFSAPRAPEGLKRMAAAIRALPEGSNVQVVIESQQFIVPWALLYDAPGEITAETVNPSGFWGYRYVLDVLPPGDYPEPTIGDLPPAVRLLFNDDQELRRFTEEQEQFVRGGLGLERVTAAWGAAEVRRTLAAAADAALLYVYCHGEHESSALRAGALPSESALMFSRGDRVRLADMRRIVSGPLEGRPLVFLNACEGATQDAFYYDGFMPFFMEECGARGFIGAEVKAPQLMAHDFALHFLELFADGMPVGEALWRLRRHYLDVHHNPLAFNYTLYGLDEVQLARPLRRKGS